MLVARARPHELLGRSMNPASPVDAHEIVRAYLTALDQQYRAKASFPVSRTALPFSRQVIQRSIRTVVESLTTAGQLSQELRETLEIAYTSLADYVDEELVQVMREYHDALSALDADGRIGREKTGTAAWGRIAETSSLVARIARAIADDADVLRAEFREFSTQIVTTAPTA
jgi:hypothetical protein